MTTILIWLGSGFAFAVGVCLGALAMRWLYRKEPPRDVPAESLLAERNRIGQVQAGALVRIAEAMEMHLDQ